MNCNKLHFHVCVFGIVMLWFVPNGAGRLLAQSVKCKVHSDTPFAVEYWLSGPLLTLS